MTRPLRWDKAGQKRARAAAAEPRDRAPGVYVPEAYTEGSFATEAPWVALQVLECGLAPETPVTFLGT